MNTEHDLSQITSEPVDNQRCWTAGPVINSHEGKGFNRTGEAMRVHRMTTTTIKVFPPEELAHRMRQPSPDIVDHLQQEGIDPDEFEKKEVSFLAEVSLPRVPETSAVKIILTSTQRQDGGIYKPEISLPRHMLCVRESPVDTVIDSLNNAWLRYHWYPPY